MKKLLCQQNRLIFRLKGMKLIALIFLGIMLSLNAFPQNAFSEKLFEHAKSTPEEIHKDIDALVSYLKKPTESKRQLAEIIAYWVMLNIEYDVKSFVNNINTPSSWETTLISTKAVCSGYANLYKELCDRVGVKSWVISGYSKGYNYILEDLEQSSHAWNIIQTDGEFHLMDLTWASGFVEMVNNRLTYFPQPDRSFLFAEPTDFIQRHIPNQPRWQLLDFPVSIEAFVGSTTLKDMIDSTSQYYNHKDSILLYLELEPIEQLIKDTEASHAFFPDNNQLAQQYEYLAYQCVVQGKRKEAFLNSIKYYKIAETLYMNNPNHTEEDLDRCKEGIKYAQTSLEKYY